MIDFHSHILPGVDHGSADLRESARQLEIIQKAGVDTIVATPHFYPNAIHVESFLTRTDQAARQLLNADIPLPTLYLGAEVLYCDSLDQMEHIDKLCIRGTELLLLELPMEKWGDTLFYTVESLLKRFTLVLAHIDRYVRYQQRELQDLLAMGAFAQINGASLFSFRTRKKLAPFIQSDRLVAIGSDLHGADQALYDQFIAAKTRLGDSFSLIMERSQALLQNARSLQVLYQ